MFLYDIFQSYFNSVKVNWPSSIKSYLKEHRQTESAEWPPFGK